MADLWRFHYLRLLDPSATPDAVMAAMLSATAGPVPATSAKQAAPTKKRKNLATAAASPVAKIRPPAGAGVGQGKKGKKVQAATGCGRTDLPAAKKAKKSSVGAGNHIELERLKERSADDDVTAEIAASLVAAIKAKQKAIAVDPSSTLSSSAGHQTSDPGHRLSEVTAAMPSAERTQPLSSAAPAAPASVGTAETSPQKPKRRKSEHGTSRENETPEQRKECKRLKKEKRKARESAASTMTAIYIGSSDKEAGGSQAEHKRGEEGREGGSSADGSGKKTKSKKNKRKSLSQANGLMSVSTSDVPPASMSAIPAHLRPSGSFFTPPPRSSHTSSSASHALHHLPSSFLTGQTSPTNSPSTKHTPTTITTTVPGAYLGSGLRDANKNNDTNATIPNVVQAPKWATINNTNSILYEYDELSTPFQPVLYTRAAGYTDARNAMMSNGGGPTLDTPTRQPR